MGAPGWPRGEGSGNGLQVGCVQRVLEPALPPGCCVWPWDSWIGPRTLLLMSMTLGSCDVQSCMWVGTSRFPGVMGGPAKGPLGAVRGGSPAQRLSTPSTSTPELSCASCVVGLWRVRGVSPTSTRVCAHSHSEGGVCG